MPLDDLNRDLHLLRGHEGTYLVRSTGGTFDRDPAIGTGATKLEAYRNARTDRRLRRTLATGLWPALEGIVD